MMSLLIKSVAQRHAWRSVLYDSEDLCQEASIILWRVLEEYPSARGIDLIRLFRKSLRRRIKDIFRMKLIKAERRVARLEAMLGPASQEQDGPASFAGSPLLPLDFFRAKLSALTGRLGRERCKRLVEVSSRINDQYLKKKEDLLREYL